MSTSERTLILVAASGLAREVIAVERTLDRYGRMFLVDDDRRLWGSTIDDVLVLGDLAHAGARDADLVVCAGQGAVRRGIVARLAELGVSPDRYPPVVHPSVDVPTGCRVGGGSILLAQTVLTGAVRVGRHVVAMPHVTLTHEVVVEDYATLCAGTSLGGSVLVGEAAYVGMNASVRQGVEIGPDAVLGMGAALVRSLPAGETWAGVPAGPLVAGGVGGA
ncbi:acetyltransferase [Nocardioides sp. W7]|uniref:acetyltransferase n=1 Tax=Nocardioides sp. W7 TaxID=2931390 RepID=UPI001FD4DCAE|nr:acetyltransferase [Nocardioides sp. W7]